MLSADNLTEKLGVWHDRMEEQYRKADAAGERQAAVATARAATAMIESFAKLAVMADFEQRLKALEQERAEDGADGKEANDGRLQALG